MVSTATTRFINLDREKRDKIERAAINEFVTYGFQGANTNRIAAEAGVSVGSLFKYFETKADLFLYLVQHGAAEAEKVVGEILNVDEPVLAKVERLLRIAVQTSRAERKAVQLYHELSGKGNAEFANTVAFKLERYTSSEYIELFRKGQQSGEIRADLEPEMLAFMMDNALMMIQYSIACEYFEERLSLYSPAADDEELIAGALGFLTGALTTQE